MPEYPTDKLENGYLPLYESLVPELGEIPRILELGVDRGGGLELFHELWPAALILGVDHNPGAVWPGFAVQLVYDQADVALPGRLAKLGVTGLELVVDDASHDGALTAASFELLFPLLVPGGVYVIEDWGVGLPGNAPDYSPSMLAFVLDLAMLFDNRKPLEVASVTLLPGLVVVRKRAGSLAG